MTRQEALNEAQKRWGAYGNYRRAVVHEVRNIERAERLGRPTHWVGWMRATDTVEVLEGSGDSFEAAFADAARRAK